ncbi:hypothetical protein G647_10042 [Cladophialophora carrionii CBS 160.54]|uniref:Telomere-associated protein Rif1 N-terminal domain-containing protein n=1 Tax=Cladophialophora carrionii CBS 160.54 TaxID=1279043 RepID=V9DKW5_9EURO|nr:uncharacterized protein G647_10042 [Cladophialophora carrionii CBS 160.54]ETI26943.1 hypothetical protein G647_10042 [Cladophialophora carrionii CBS 160.54]
MSIHAALPLSPPSTSSRRKIALMSSSVQGTSPASSSASFPGSSHTGSRKRVGFSTGADIHRPVSTSQPPSSGARPPFTSSDSQSSLRSILKPVTILEETAQTRHGLQDGNRSMVAMMDSFIEQLSHDDRSLSLDAYQTLANVIRNYEDIPDEDVLKAKINTFMKYIKRDLLRKLSPEEPPIADTNLITQALRLLIIFVWNKDYASLLSDDARTFVLDRSIQVLAEHTASKNVIVHYLHLLAAQNFRQTLITSHRVARLLEALRALSEHYKGNGVISERLLVYQKLLDQERPTMKAKANIWVDELLTGATNSLKDIRMKAIDLGEKACSAFPASSSISSVIRSTLARELASGKTFSSSMCRKLEKMIAVKEEGVQVPRIWTIVLRLCNNVDDRGRNGWGPRCDKWAQFKDWLSVIQKCFNCSESTIQQQAYQAWNRFIHIVQPHLASDNLLQLLPKPMTAKLERHGGEAATKGTRVAAVSSYCTLLYHAFRPAANHHQYTRVWNEYIVKVMKSAFFERGTANSDLASRIVMALFWNPGRAKIWNENRALENTPVEPEELPTIDCKWVRSKARPILDIFLVLMRYSSWGASGQSDKAYIAVAWLHFLKAVQEAGRKEIKPSAETVEAMVHVNAFLGRLYLDVTHPSVGDGRPTGPHTLRIGQVRQLTVTAVRLLGHDLIMAGLEDKGHCLSNALVIYDSLQFHLLEQQQSDESSTTSLETCLKSLDAALVHGFNSETTSGTNISISQLQKRLEGSSVRQIVHTLTLLKRPTVLILKQGISSWQDKDQHEPSRRYPEIVKATLTLLARLPVEAVGELEETFSALLSSRHNLVVQDTVDMWNQRFGKLPSLSLGPILSEAISKLRDAGVEITVPSKPHIRNDAAKQHMSPQAAPAEDLDTTSRHMSTSPTAAIRGADRSPELGSQHFHSVAREESPVMGSSPRQQSLRPRSRHDDSQVYFVPIESSPLPQEETESQSLTTHQKEVRDQQRSEPALVFPDLRSSPRPHTRSITHTDCEFARKAASQAERPSTPTLPTNEEQNGTELMASPTPRARHFTNLIPDIEVPSSPPSMVGNDDRTDVNSSPLLAVEGDAGDRIDLAIEQIEGADEHGAVELHPSAAIETVALKAAASLGQEALVTDIADAGAGGSIEFFQDPQAEERTGSMGAGESKGEASNARRRRNQPKKHATRGDDVAALSSSGRVRRGRSRLRLSKSPAQQIGRRAVGVTSSTEVQSSSPPPHQDCEDSHLEKDAAPAYATVSPSLRPITINLASDSTTSEEAEQREASPTKPVATDSDEIDILSASQLSHDLDLHVSQTAGAGSYGEEGTDEASRWKKQKSRKRKSSTLNLAAAKRRKSSKSSSQNSSTSRDAEMAADEIPGEILDCVEVSPSPEDQAIASVQLSESALTPRRRRGRPRKRTLIEVIVPETSLVKQEKVDITGVSAASSVQDEQKEVLHTLDQEAEIHGATSTMVTDAMELTTTGGVAESAPRERSCPSDIAASLQHVLDRLKSADPTDIDLRRVDDLCFQIRFQAQFIAQQQMLNGDLPRL